MGKIGPGGERGRTILRILAGHLSLLGLLCGCEQKMGRQPSYRGFEASTFFPDGRSARPQVPGTVARGQRVMDRHLATGQQPEGRIADVAALVGSTGAGVFGAAALGSTETNHARTFPFRVDREVLQHGRDRYRIFCVVCHDPLGSGQGKIVKRGYTPPPSFHTDFSRGLQLQGRQAHLRDVPVGYIFDVITNGMGAMPDYAEQIPPHDRWAIVAYIRALQFSQNVPVEQLTEEDRRQLEEKGQPR